MCSLSVSDAEEPDSDYDYEKDTVGKRSHSRGRRSVAVKRAASRRSSRTHKEVKTPKIQTLPKARLVVIFMPVPYQNRVTQTGFAQ